jgi:hypothetical protein
MASTVGGLVGMQEGQKGAHKAARSYQQAISQFENIGIPDIASQELALLMPEYQGDYMSQQEAALGLGPSAMEGVSSDPRLQEAQMASLEKLSQMGESGLLPGEEAALRQSRRGAAGEAQAKNQQIMDDMARRGMGGSGAELAARLQASQSGADRMSQENDRVMQMAQERALGAIGQSANLAGQIRGQQFGEKSDVAKAKDYINQFNTQNQQSVQQRNVATTNAANMRNLTEKQRLGEAATANKNQQQVHNKGLVQQEFNNKMQKAGGLAGQYQQQGANRQAQANNTAQMRAQTGAATDEAVSNWAGMMAMSDERSKKNIKKFDAKEFLDQICPVEFEYIDSRNGEGGQVGIMAQDLEKIMPSAIKEDEGGMKHIDYSKLVAPMAASLASINERLSKIETGDDEE